MGECDDYLITSRCNAWAHGERYSRVRPLAQPEVGGVAERLGIEMSEEACDDRNEQGLTVCNWERMMRGMRCVRKLVM